MMKRAIWLGLVASLALGAGHAQAQERNRESRDALRARLRELEREMEGIRRQLGDAGGIHQYVEPLILSMGGNRARLGVIVNTERAADTDSIGAVLEAVTPDGPAVTAGLEAGDIIVTFDGVALAETRRWQTPGDRLVELVRDLDEGDSVRVEYRRDGDRRSTTVIAERVPGFSYSVTVPRVRAMVDTLRAGALLDPTRVFVYPGRAFGNRFTALSLFGAPWADAELVTLDEDLGRYFGATEGLLVVKAPRDDLLGLQSGDVILRIGGRVPSSPSHAIRILGTYEPGDEVRIDIMRNRQRTSVTATVPERDRGLFWEGREF